MEESSAGSLPVIKEKPLPMIQEFEAEKTDSKENGVPSISSNWSPFSCANCAFATNELARIVDHGLSHHCEAGSLLNEDIVMCTVLWKE